MKNKMRITIFLFFITGIVSCKSTSGTGDNEEHTQKKVQESVFILPEIPPMYSTPESRREFLILHYWDHFDFTDLTLVNSPEITEQAFVDYVVLFPEADAGTVRKGIEVMMEKAARNDEMYHYFLELFDKYSYDPNSPMRNEEAYLMVLEYFLDHYEGDPANTSKIRFRRDMLYKNRPGTPATNIKIKLASGKTEWLHNVRSEYTILYFNNPGCQACKEIQNILVNSLIIRKAESEGKLKIFAVYPDEDLAEWEKEIPTVPVHWINGYDEGIVISTKKLYDLKAIPSLYLLDKDKKVILRDAAVESVINYLYQH